jgi:hypothetical protein
MSSKNARIRRSVKVIADEEAEYGYHSICSKETLIQGSLLLLRLILNAANAGKRA